VSTTPCFGQSELFDSTDQPDHAKAANLCLGLRRPDGSQITKPCPFLAGCKKLLDDTLETYGKGGPRGTWAGILVEGAAPMRKFVSVGDCPTCGATDGRVCTSANGKAVGKSHVSRGGTPPTCGICLQGFTPNAKRLRYCSDACAHTARLAVKARSYAKAAA
jgi:hypothetical protein